MSINRGHSHTIRLSTSLPVDITQAFTDLLGDSQLPLKGALRVARLIEEQFLTDGWQIGRLYGGEAELARRYDAGEAMIREAIRILEARGTARMRTGRNASLAVTAPSHDQLCEGTSSYCSLLGISRAQIVGARALLDRAAARIAADAVAAGRAPDSSGAELVEADGQNWRGWLFGAARNPAMAFYTACLDYVSNVQAQDGGCAIPAAPSVPWQSCVERLRVAVQDGDAASAAKWADACSRHSSVWERTLEDPQRSAARPHPQHSKRALQIVDDLLRSLGPGEWRDGVLLGNEQELSERYDVDRRSLRQAIRVLEASQVALTMPGRGHGLMACTPKPASFSRLICCHFAATGMTRNHVFQAFEWLSIETVAYVAEHADPARVATVARNAASARQSREVIPRQQAELEEQLFALADNPVLELFLRSARAYNSLGGFGKSPPKVSDVSDITKSIDDLAGALVARDASAAARAQARKCAIVRGKLDAVRAS